MQKTPAQIADFATSDKPSAKQVVDLHTHDDVDGSPKAHHHTNGPGPNQSSPGNHSHDGGASAVILPLQVAGVTLTGSKANLAQMMATIIPALVALGAVDNTTP